MVIGVCALPISVIAGFLFAYFFLGSGSMCPTYLCEGGKM
jgi:hypothetical protein